MNLLPFEKYRLNTKLKKSEIISRLKEVVELKSLSSFSFSWSKIEKPYKGKIDDSGFTIQRVIRYRNSFLPTIYGEIGTDFHGTFISIKMQMHILIYIFMAIWLGGVAIAGFAIYFFQPNPGENMGLGILVIALMFLFGIAVSVGGFKYESSKAKRFLAELFEGEEQGG